MLFLLFLPLNIKYNLVTLHYICFVSLKVNNECLPSTVEEESYNLTDYINNAKRNTTTCPILSVSL